jgi:hypothetical protein
VQQALNCGLALVHDDDDQGLSALSDRMHNPYIMPRSQQNTYFAPFFPVEDDEFPTYFQQIGSPPRLFHSHGTYVLPVDIDETKVCYQRRACADMISLYLYFRCAETGSPTYHAP